MGVMEGDVSSPNGLSVIYVCVIFWRGNAVGEDHQH
jgi:hypothetical protein